MSAIQEEDFGSSIPTITIKKEYQDYKARTHRKHAHTRGHHYIHAYIGFLQSSSGACHEYPHEYIFLARRQQ